MSVKISVVMPVYNVEKFIGKAIESVLKQTYKNFELIIVNDKTPDRSIEIAEEYAKIDNRIKIINKEKNEGLGYARNTGMNVSEGKYIYFIDSDDFIEPNTLEVCIHRIEKDNSDIVIFGYSEDYEENNVTTKREMFKCNERVLSKKEFRRNFTQLFTDTIIHSTCNKLYKLDIIKNNNIKFRKVSMCEDTFFNLELAKVINKVSISSEVLYHYMKRNIETLIVKYNPERFKFMCEIQENTFELIKSFNENSHSNCGMLNKKYLKTVIFCIIQLFNKNSNLSYSDRITGIKEICNNDQVRSAILNVSNPSKVEKIYINMLQRKEVGRLYWYSYLANFLKNKLNYIYRIIK